MTIFGSTEVLRKELVVCTRNLENRSMSESHALVLLIFGVVAAQSEFTNPRAYYSNDRAKRATKSAGCGGEYTISHDDLEIVSPVEGTSYSPKLDCLWTLVASGSCVPEILCKNIDLRPLDCNEEYLQISDGVGGELKLCGSVKSTFPLRRASNRGRDLFVRFQTSKDETFDRKYNGFSCSIKCAKDLRNVTSQKLPPDNVVRKENHGCICGVKNDDDRIVGGVDATKNEFPWQAAIVKPRTRNPVCGGSVINSRWILSAAHCFWFKRSKPADFQVLLNAHLLNFQFMPDYNENANWGENGSIVGPGWDLAKKTDEDEKSLRFAIEKIIWHPMFTKEYDYDVALVRVKGHIPLDGETSPVPVCLPPVGAYSANFEKAVATVSGWGIPHETAGATTRLLQKLQVPIIKQSRCQDRLPSYQITHRMLCAGFEEGMRDSCKGDSGGPLAVKLSKYQYTQIGITSWGEGCARKQKPGVYSRLTELVQWIHYHTRRSEAVWCKKSME